MPGIRLLVKCSVMFIGTAFCICLLVFVYWYSLVFVYWYSLVCVCWYSLVFVNWYSLVFVCWYSLVFVYWYDLCCYLFRLLIYHLDVRLFT